MTKPTADRQPRQSRLAHPASGTARVSAVAPLCYLQTIRKLLAVYQRMSGVPQQQVFVEMMHAFMQELCGYPPSSYVVTNAAYGQTAAGNAPHVVPIAYVPRSSLFYFTASTDPDDVQDLWVKQAQVYLVIPGKQDLRPSALPMWCAAIFW